MLLSLNMSLMHGSDQAQDTGAPVSVLSDAGIAAFTETGEAVIAAPTRRNDKGAVSGRVETRPLRSHQLAPWQTHPLTMPLCHLCTQRTLHLV